MMLFYRINFVCTTIILLFFVSSVAPMMRQEEVQHKLGEIVKDPSHWMQRLRELCPSFNERSIADWTLMGTHNAATGYMTKDNVLFYGLDLGDLTPDYAKNQGLSIFDQLYFGVRYFDMRTYFQNPNTATSELYVPLLGSEFGIYCSHEYAVFNHAMVLCLSDIARFVMDREELVILNFSNFFAHPTLEDHEKLADLFEAIFQHSLILCDGSNPNTIPFEQLIAKGRVIIFYDDQFRSKSEKLRRLTYADKLVVSHWHGKNQEGQQVLCQSWPQIESDYVAVYGPKDYQGCLKVLQLHVQPDADFIIKSCLCGKTLQTWAHEIEPHIIELLVNDPQEYKINVIQVDFFERRKNDSMDFLAATIYYNIMSTLELSFCCGCLSMLNHFIELCSSGVM